MAGKSYKPKDSLREASESVYLTKEEQEFVAQEASRYGVSRSDIIRASINVIKQMR